MVRVAREDRADGVAGGDGAHVVITVRDAGAGIAPDVLAHIFDPYVTTKPGGTGLGLAIARQTMAAHGGDISATSAPGAGTEMRLRLPITRVGDTV